jgi:L-iditol 2-dehydrogenase
MGLSHNNGSIPDFIRAGVYRGEGRVVLEQVPRPLIGPGELLVKVAACGICNTDVKKITANLLPPPRVYGHETAGTVVEVGSGVDRFKPGDRVAVFHHVPCRHCFYCEHRLYAQCPTYKKVGVTAGFEPAGGGFAEYVRVMDWITARGVQKIPDGISFEEATWLEPLNTCLKAVRVAKVSPGEQALVFGQGPIGLLFLLLARREGARVIVSDVMEERLARSREFGAAVCLNASEVNVVEAVRPLSAGRGVDLAIVAAAVPALISQALDAVRPGGRVLLFAQTDRTERVPIPTAPLCMDEKQLLGSYSADWELQPECMRLVFDRLLPLRSLITHRFPLAEIDSAIRLAANPRPDSLKIIVECT